MLGMLLGPWCFIVQGGNQTFSPSGGSGWTQESSSSFKCDAGNFTSVRFSDIATDLNIYLLQVGPPPGWSFDPSKTNATSGTLINPASSSDPEYSLRPTDTNAAAKKGFSAKDEPTSFTVGLAGKLKRAGNGGSPPSWSASAGTNFFWLWPMQKLVKVGTDVEITAKTTKGSTTSTWTVNSTDWEQNGSKKTASSIKLDASLWTDMGWNPSPIPSGFDPPTVGVYIITATTTETVPRSASAIVYEADLGNVKYKKNGWGGYKEVRESYQIIPSFPNKTCSFNIDVLPSTIPADMYNTKVTWSGPVPGTTLEVTGTLTSGSQSASFIALTKSATVLVQAAPTGDSDTEYALTHPIDTTIASYHGLTSATGEAFTWANSTYPGSQLNTIADAARHSYWNCLLTRYVSAAYAIGVATGHEVGSTIETETIMDLHNNEVGRGLAGHTHGSDNTCCRNAVIAAISAGNLWYLDSSYGSSDTAGIGLIQPTNKP